MKLTITPTRLSGAITPPPSKSQLHRLILASALAQGDSVIENAALSEDISATLRCAQALGAAWTLEGSTLRLTGNGGNPPGGNDLPHFDCGESGSTLRFLIPISLVTAGGGIFTGRGRLMERPLAPYFDIFREKNVLFEQIGNTLTIKGKLSPGEYRLPGNVSSQFFTGLLYALPLLEAPSVITSTTPLESADYVAMTVDVLRRSGVTIGADPSLPHRFTVPGHSVFSRCRAAAEADWSQAAFWYAAGEMGSTVTPLAINRNSPQGDSIFPHWMDLLRQGGDLTICAAQNPDLVPPLAARSAVMDGTLRITGISRLRLKESDRVAAIAGSLAALGADITEEADSLVICGRSTLTGGTADCRGDHRIAMMLAIAATRCESPVTLTGAECVSKSYPHFWEDYQKLGGIVHEHIGK